jgi:membrane protease YdiL (CAAX protease family)
VSDRSGRAIVVTGIAGVVGFATDRAATSLGWHFPSFGYLAGEVIWKVATVVVMTAAVRRFERGRLDRATTGFADSPRRMPGRQELVVVTLVALGAVAASKLVGSSASSPSSFGAVHHAGLVLVLAEVLVRYPLTVFAEESFFRGWLQPRLPGAGVAGSALLWAGYHLQQVRTIPSLVLFGLGLGLIRAWTGNVRATALLHYGANVAFFVSTYA